MRVLASVLAFVAVSSVANAAEPVVAISPEAQRALLASSDPQLAANKKLVWDIEKYAMGDKAWMFPVLWWYRIIPYISKVRGYRAGSNHYTTMDMANIWIADK